MVERWCAPCILRARHIGIHAESVILSDVQHCESKLHEEAPLHRAIKARANVIMKRNDVGQFIGRVNGLEES